MEKFENIKRTFAKYKINIIYKLECKSCDTTYVGQTKRLLT